MATLEVIRTNDETKQEVLNEVYASLQVSSDASVLEVVKAIEYREGARRSFSFGETPADAARNEFIYTTSILDRIEKEVDRVAALGIDGSEAVAVMADSIKPTNGLSLDKRILQQVDERLLDRAIEVIADVNASPIKKALATISSRNFAIEQRAVDKPQMILARRLVAQQAAHLHANRDAREKIERELDSIKTYFYLAEIDYSVELIDSKVTAATQRAAELAQARLEKAREALDTGTQVGRRAAAATVIATVTFGGGATAAAADNTVSVESGSGGSDISIAQTITSETQAALETPIAAVVAIDPIDVEAVHIDTESTSLEPNDVVVVESLGDGEVAASTITVGTAPAEDLGPITVEMTEPNEDEALPALSIGEHHEGDGHDHGQEEAAPAVPAAVESSEPKADEEGVVAPSEPITLVAPNNDVNVAVGETPQEAITRIVGSRDMKAASFAIRQNFGGVDVVNQPTVNEMLSGLIAADTETLKAQIPEAAHADAAYTDKAFMALAYLNAATHSPSLLDNPEIAAFVTSITDQGEAYRNKLFATYLAEAKVALSAEKAGAYSNVAEQYRVPIETLYAYVALAAVSDQGQLEQIEAIKAEEARIAEEKRQQELAAQAQQQAGGYSEAANNAANAKGAEYDQNIENIIASLNLEESKKNFVREMVAALKELQGQDLPVNVNVMLAQAVLESGYGQSKLSTNYHNLFGMKAGSSWTGPTADLPTQEYENGSAYTTTARWRVYDTYGASIQDYAFGLIGAKPHYQDAVAAKADENAYLDGLLGPDMAYATDPNYKNKIFERIEGLRIREITSLINEKPAAMQAERDRVAAEEAAAAAAAAEAEARRIQELQAQGDMRPGLADGLAIREQLKGKYGGVSGRLDNADLREVGATYNDGTPIKIYLNPAAVDSFNALNAAYQANFGGPILLTDHYRDYDAQVRTKAKKGALAAKPGTSNHGWGMAIDFAGSIQYEGSPQHEWMEQNAHKYGWVNPSWAHDGNPRNGAQEPWHWEYEGNQASFEKTNG